MTSVDLSALPSVAFAPQSAGETETAIITAYEAIAKATLQPGDPVRLFLESLAYILSVSRTSSPTRGAVISTISARRWA